MLALSLPARPLQHAVRHSSSKSIGDHLALAPAPSRPLPPPPHPPCQGVADEAQGPRHQSERDGQAGGRAGTGAIGQDPARLDQVDGQQVRPGGG